MRWDEDDPELTVATVRYSAVQSKSLNGRMPTNSYIASESGNPTIANKNPAEAGSVWVMR